MKNLEIEEMNAKEVKLRIAEYDEQGRMVGKRGVVICFYEENLPIVKEGEIYPKLSINSILGQRL